MSDSLEKIKYDDENPDVQKPPRQKERERAGQEEIKSPEQQREDIVSARKKPNEETLHRQKDRAGETFSRSIDEEEVELEKDLLREQLEKGGIQLSKEEIQGLYEAIPDMVDGISPEFSKHVAEMMPRLEKALEETGKLNVEGNEYKAIERLSDFIGDEMKLMEKIKDEHVREQIITFVAESVDIDKVVDRMKKQTTVDGATEIAKIVPVVGPGIDLAEAASGRSAAGEKLSGGKRVKRAALGTAFMVMDVAGIATAGGTTAVRAGISAAKAGKGVKDVGKAASAAYKVAKAAKKTGKATTLATRGARMGKSVTRFAAYCRKTKRLKNISHSIFKVGKLIQRHPKLAGIIAKTMNIRASYKTAKGRAALAGKEIKAVGLANKVHRMHPQKTDKEQSEAA